MFCQRLGKGKKPVPAPLQSMPLVSEPFAQVAIEIIGPLPICWEPQLNPVIRTPPADVPVQSPVIEESESPAPTSIPSSVPTVETMLSRVVGQPTPLPAPVLIQTSVSDRFACPVSTSRKDSDNVHSVPSKTTSRVHSVGLRPGAKWDQRPSFRWRQAKARVCRDRHSVVVDRDQSVMNCSAPTNRRQYQWRSRPTHRTPVREGRCYFRPS